MTMTVDVRGDEALLRKLEPNGLLGPALRGLMQDAALVVEGEAKRRAKPHSVDTGRLANSIQSQVESRAVPLHASVFTKLEYARAAEFGRGPGRMPPVEPIEDWARRHGSPGLGFVIARAIGRRGTRGIRYMREGAEAAKGKFPALVAKAAQEIKQRWQR